MRIINYIPGYFCSDVFIVPFTSEPTFLTANSVVKSNNSMLKTYLDLVKSSNVLKYDTVGLKTNYNLFTIDLKNRTELYLYYNGSMHNLLSIYDELLTGLYVQDMSNYVHGSEVTYDVLSMQTSLSYHITTPIGFPTKSMFTSNNLASTRLLNIAVPKEFGTDFYQSCNLPLTSANDIHNISVTLIEQTIYNRSDFNYVVSPTGQYSKLLKREDLKISCSVTAFEHTEVIMLHDTYSELYKLSDYATITEDSKYIYVHFDYNANRTYKLQSNTRQIDYIALPNTAIEIIGSDMLLHAKELGILAYDNYYINDSKSSEITLKSVTTNRYVKNMPIVSWQTSDYNYKDTKSSLKFKDTNYGYWTSAYFMNRPLQMNSTLWSTDTLLQQHLRLQDNTINYFLINRNSAIIKQLLPNEIYDSTSFTTSTGLSNALSYLDLPYIIDKQCTFRNIKLKFLNSYNNGKRFAIIVCHRTNAILDAELVSDSNFAALLLYVDFSTVTTAKSIKCLNGRYTTTIYDQNNPFNESHTGSNSIQNTYDLITIKDFYDSNVAQLLPINLAQKNIVGLTFDLLNLDNYDIDIPIQS